MSSQEGAMTFSNLSNQLLQISEMCEHLTSLTQGWPICVSGDLCYRDGAELRPLRSATALFAWIDQHARVSWRRGGVTKEEFFEGLLQQAQRFDWASPFPHFPPIRGVYYTYAIPAALYTGALDALVDRFAPATPHDRQLLKALVMTLYWGGPAGKRPVFVITSDDEIDR